MSNKVFHFIRWICVIPASAIGMLLGYILSYIFGIVLNYGIAPEWIVKLSSNIISGFSFVLLGSYVSPVGKKIVSIVLCTIYIVFFIFNLIIQIWTREWTAIWTFYSISSCVGAVIASVYIYNSKDFENESIPLLKRENPFKSYNNMYFFDLIIMKKEKIDYSLEAIEKELDYIKSNMNTNDLKESINLCFNIIGDSYNRKESLEPIKSINSSCRDKLRLKYGNIYSKNVYDSIFYYCMLYSVNKIRGYFSKENKLKSCRPVTENDIIFHYGKFNVCDLLTTDSILNFKLKSDFTTIYQLIPKKNVDIDISHENEIYINGYDIQGYNSSVFLLFDEKRRLKSIIWIFVFGVEFKISYEYDCIFNSIKDVIGKPISCRNMYREMVFNEKPKDCIWRTDVSLTTLSVFNTGNNKFISIKMENAK